MSGYCERSGVTQQQSHSLFFVGLLGYTSMIQQQQTTMTNNKIEVPKEVHRQLNILRESGKVNMITEVKRGLKIMNFDTALNWVNNNPEKYSKGVFNGFTPIDNNE